MLGGRGGDDLYILDLSGRDLFQGLGPGKYTGLSIYVDCESATPPVRSFKIEVTEEEESPLSIVIRSKITLVACALVIISTNSSKRYILIHSSD